MEYLFRHVAIYADSEDNLLIIPSGHSEKWGGATVELDIVNRLDYPYTDKQLEDTLKTALLQCFSMKPDDNLKTSSIEKYLNIKGYGEAVKGRRYISFRWHVNDGYTFTPTTKIPKQGYVSNKEHVINIGHELTQGEVAKALREAMKLSEG